MAAEKTATKTAYHILKQTRAQARPDNAATGTPQVPAFDLVATNIEAHSSDHAIKTHAEKSKDAGSFIAVPSRSWRLVTVTVETQQIVKLA